METRWTGAESHEQERAELFVNIEQFLACFKSNSTTALMALDFEANLVAVAHKKLFVEQKYIRERKCYAKVTDMESLEVDFLPDLEKKQPWFFN